MPARCTRARPPTSRPPTSSTSPHRAPSSASRRRERPTELGPHLRARSCAMVILNLARRRLTSVLVALVAVVCAGIGIVATPVHAAGPGYVPLAAPARLLDTRNDGVTVDGQFRAIGVRPAGGVLELPVAGRAGVAAGTTSV